MQPAPPEPLTILYRGFLSSCNYACGYCPFAKHSESRSEHARDAAALTRFVDWVARRESPVSILFTPWGEALVRSRYQRAVAHLSHLPQVQKVAVQTNGSWGLRWLESANVERLALWITFHPSQVSLERFVARAGVLRERGVRFSVGAVGLREHLGIIEALRAALPEDIYLWVNALDRRPRGYYAPDDLARLRAVDPWFGLNLERYRSRGQSCRAGHTAISVSGDGTVRRCHFIDTPIGNLYDPDFERHLRPSPCTKSICDCHIGYVHRPRLEPSGLDPYEVFAGGVLERIPAAWPMRNGAG